MWISTFEDIAMLGFLKRVGNTIDDLWETAQAWAPRPTINHRPFDDKNVDVILHTRANVDDGAYIEVEVLEDLFNYADPLGPYTINFLDANSRVLCTLRGATKGQNYRLALPHERMREIRSISSTPHEFTTS